MKKSMATLMIAAWAVAGAVFAADAVEPVEPIDAVDAGKVPDGKASADLEAKLDAARERLEKAASEVAELSAEIGKPVMDRFMMMGDGPRRAIIGVQLDPAGGKDGVKVKEVSPGGPAAEAGIRAQDVIVMVDGKEVKGGDSAREVARIMRRVQPESKVNVRVLRDGKPKEFIVIARPAFGMFEHPLPPPPPGAPPDMDFEFNTDTPMAFFRAFRGEFSDMELVSLTPQLGKYFGTEEGVLVVRAPEGGALKLEDGDVILSIDGRKPSNGSHATRILRSYQPGEKVNMRVMRQKKAINLEATLPAERERVEERKVKILRSGEEPT